MSSLARRTAALAARIPALRDDLRDALRSAKVVSEKKATLDPRTLNQLVEMAAESAGLDASDARATREVNQAAKKFTHALSKALSLWTQKHPPENGATVSDLMRAEAAYAVFMTLEEHGVGIWDGRWDQFYDDTRKLEQFLERALDREYRELRDAIEAAAYEAAGEGF